MFCIFCLEVTFLVLGTGVSQKILGVIGFPGEILEFVGSCFVDQCKVHNVLEKKKKKKKKKKTKKNKKKKSKNAG